MYDFPNESHLLSQISQGFVGRAGNVMVRDRTAIPELQCVPKQQEGYIGIRGMSDRRVSLQERDRERVPLVNRPVTAKGRLESNDNAKDNVRAVVGTRPISGHSNDRVATKSAPSPGKPDLTPYKEKFEILPAYRPQIFPAKTYLTRQGNLMLYAVRDQRQNEFPAVQELYEKKRFRPVSAMVKPKSANGQKGVTRNNKPEVRPKSAPPNKVSAEQETINSGDKSINRTKTDAELFAELKAEINAGNHKKQNRPISAKRKTRNLSAKKRKKVSTNTTPNGDNVSQEGHNTGVSSEEVALGSEVPSDTGGLMRVEGRGGGTAPLVADPRRARLREQAEKRRLEMETMRQQMRSQLISQSESEPVISDSELDSLLVPDDSSSPLECELSVEELERKVSSHSLLSSDNSLSDLLANRIAEQKRHEALEASRAAAEARRREDQLLQLAREEQQLLEREENMRIAAREREREAEERRQLRLQEWIEYQEDIKRERFDSLSKAYWRANCCKGISRAYTFSYFQSAKRETPRLTHAKKDKR